MKYHSQAKQDLIIDNLMKGKDGGTFIDIGANDGITYSNSFFFEKERNWSGICIEPIKETFQKLKENRKCILVNGAVYESDQMIRFKNVRGYSEMLSGILEYRSSIHDERTERELSAHGGYSEIIEVRGLKFSTILDKYNIKAVDYLSLDIEGGEFEVLNSIDFNIYDISFLTVENNYSDDRIRQLMKSRGFIHLFHCYTDDFFLKREQYRFSLVLNKIIFPIWLDSQIKTRFPFLHRIYKKLKFIIQRILTFQKKTWPSEK